MGSITWKRVHAIPFPPTRGLRRVARRAGMDGACARRLWTKEEIEGDTPSRKEGVPSAVEALCRRAACQLVIDTGARLKLCVAFPVERRARGRNGGADAGVERTPQAAAHRGHVHRVLPGVLRQAVASRIRPSGASPTHPHAWKRNNRNEADTCSQDMALTCLFLACKVEETPRSLVDVINVGYALAYRKHPDKVQQLSDKAYFQKHVEKVTRAEGVLLHTLQFELEVDKPYPYMEKLSKCLPLDMPEDVKINLLQLAWDHVNNSYKTTTVCMQYPAGDIASACTHFAAALLHVLPILGPEDGREFFWNTFGTSRKVRDEIMSQLLLVYE